MTKREKTKDLFFELINEQLKPHNVSYDDVKGDPQWYMNYTTTVEKEQEFIDHCVNRIREVLKVSKALATKEAQWFILQWGLALEHSNSSVEKINKNQKTL